MYNDLKKQLLDNGVSIAYKDGDDLNNLTDELIDGIFHLQKDDNPIELSFYNSKIQENLASYSNILKKLLKSYDIKERNEIFKDLDTINLIDNIRYIYILYDENITLDRMINILNNNKFLLKNNIQNISKNYSYLRKQQYIHMEDLDKYYIGNNINNMKTKIDSLLLSNTKIPKNLELLSVKSSDYNKYLLSENLRLIIKYKGLIDYNDILKNKTKTLFNHNLLENLNRIDKKDIKDDLLFIEKSKHREKFIGIRGNLNDILNKINPKFINNLNELYNTNEYEEFLDNFETIKNWDKYQNEIERITDLRDEFITKIIYVTLKKASLNEIENNYEDRNKINNFIKKIKKGSLDKYKEITIDAGLLKEVTGDEWKDYFDEKKFRGRNKPAFINALTNKIVEVYPPANKFIKIKQIINNSIDYDEEILKILNYDILDKRPDNKTRNRIVEDTYKLLTKIETCNDSNKKALLKRLFKTLNYYMVLNSELDIQNYNQQLMDESENKNININQAFLTKNSEVDSLARKMVKGKGNFTFDERIIYYLYNSNRLAHSPDFIGLFRNIDDNFVVKSNTKEEKNEKRSLIKKYAFLNRYGIDIDFVNKSIDNYMDNNNENITIYNVIDRNTKKKGKELEFLNDSVKKSTISYLQNNINNNLYCYKQEIDDSSIINILMCLEEIKNNPNNDMETFVKNKKIRESIATITKERNLMFTIKRCLINELVKNTEKKTNIKVEDMTRADKKRIYDKDGYIIEYQVDDHEPVLVCYDKRFNSVFSVHDISNSDKLNTSKLEKEQSLKHYINVTGISLANDPETYDLNYDENLTSGFINSYKKITKIEANANNKIKFQYAVYQGEIKEPKDLFKKRDYLIKEKKRIYKAFGIDNLKNNNKKIGNVAIDTINSSINNINHDIVNNENTIIYEDMQIDFFGERYNVKSAGRVLNIPKEELLNYLDKKSRYYNLFNNDNKKTK